MSCAKTRTFVMTCTFVWISVSKKIIAQGFNAICRIQKIPAIHRNFSGDAYVHTLKKPTASLELFRLNAAICFLENTTVSWGPMTITTSRPDAWRRRNQAIWKTRFHFCEANRDIWTNIRVHQRHGHHILLHMLLCNQSNRQLIW